METTEQIVDRVYQEVDDFLLQQGFIEVVSLPKRRPNRGYALENDPKVKIKVFHDRDQLMNVHLSSPHYCWERGVRGPVVGVSTVKKLIEEFNALKA